MQDDPRFIQPLLLTETGEVRNEYFFGLHSSFESRLETLLRSTGAASRLIRFDLCHVQAIQILRELKRDLNQKDTASFEAHGAGAEALPWWPAAGRDWSRRTRSRVRECLAKAAAAANRLAVAWLLDGWGIPPGNVAARGLLSLADCAAIGQPVLK